MCGLDGSAAQVRFGMAVVSLLWMPRLADTKGVPLGRKTRRSLLFLNALRAWVRDRGLLCALRKLCILISVFGTAIAYGLQGNAYLFSGCERQLHSMPPGDSMNLWAGHERLSGEPGPDLKEM